MINLLRYSNEKKKIDAKIWKCEMWRRQLIFRAFGSMLILAPSGFSGHSLKRSSAFSIQFSEHDVVIVSRPINNIPEMKSFLLRSVKNVRTKEPGQPGSALTNL